MNTRPAPSLLGRDFHDLVLGLVCFPGNQPTVCSPDWTGRGRRSSVASNPICVSDASGLSKRFLELERILGFSRESDYCDYRYLGSRDWGWAFALQPWETNFPRFRYLED
jgi:hypothetical protein